MFFVVGLSCLALSLLSGLVYCNRVPIGLLLDFYGVSFLVMMVIIIILICLWFMIDLFVGIPPYISVWIPRGEERRGEVTRRRREERRREDRIR